MFGGIVLDELVLVIALALLESQISVLSCTWKDTLKRNDDFICWPLLEKCPKTSRRRVGWRCAVVQAKCGSFRTNRLAWMSIFVVAFVELN